MLEFILAWYNLPFWGMMIFVFMLLGTTLFLGQLGSDADADTTFELDTDADLAIDTDIDVDADVDMNFDVDADADVDMDVDTDLDTEIHISASSAHSPVIHAEGSVTTVDATELKSEKARPGFIFVLFAHALNILNPGKVPLSVLGSSLLMLWASVGLIANYIIFSIFNNYPLEQLVFTVVFLSSFVLSVPFTRGTSRIFSKIFESKSYHTSTKDYIGMSAKVVSHEIPTLGEVNTGNSIGILDLVDTHGNRQKIYAFIPDNCKSIPKYKDNVVIIDYIEDRRLYKVLLEDSNEYLKWQRVNY